MTSKKCIAELKLALLAACVTESGAGDSEEAVFLLAEFSNELDEVCSQFMGELRGGR